jgi:hypothetical protein
MKTKKPPIASTILGLVIDLLIDFTLIGLGVALYYQFMMYPILPITISPALTNLVGGYSNAVYILCGVPIVIGVLSLVHTLSRTYHKLTGS